MCGEMSGDPLSPAAVGLGLRQLSLAPHNMPEVKAVVRRLERGRTRERIAAEAMTLESARDVSELPAPRATSAYTRKRPAAAKSRAEVP